METITADAPAPSPALDELELERAVWTTAYINDLPDSSFLYVAPGGSKDSDGKTTPRSLRSFPYKDANGSVDLPHLRNALSRIPQSNLPASVKQTLTTKAQKILDGQRSEDGPPLDGLVRAEPGGLELREAPGIGGDRVLAGHFAVFDQWTEVNSLYEGHFLEQVAPGAFAKTIRENTPRMRVLFEHGKDYELGSKPLGVIRSLEETNVGAAYEVALFDGIPPLVLNGLRHGQYGSSFRFSVIKQQLDRSPEASDYNPEALPERRITEARVHEFGPVTFPAYPQADAGLRSLT